MIDHLRFNKQDYYPASILVSDYLDIKLIGKTITYSKYKVAWYVANSDDSIGSIDSRGLEWTTPYRISDIASTGKIYGAVLDENNIPYYMVNFDHLIDSYSHADGVYDEFIKATDIMSKYLAGEDL